MPRQAYTGPLHPELAAFVAKGHPAGPTLAKPQQDIPATRNALTRPGRQATRTRLTS